MRSQRAIDVSLGALATAQHGVVSRAQLRTLGLSADRIDRRVGRGRLHVVHRGVYAVGHRTLTVEGRWMAAVLASGACAVLSHASAAAAWDLRRVDTGAVHVTVPGDPGRRRRADLRIHRSTTLHPTDTTTHRAIPITTPLRTIVDVAGDLKGRSLEQVLDRADQLRLIDFAALRRRLEDQPGRPGSRSLRAVLTLYGAGSTVTRSEMEELFLDLCDRHRVPRPVVNSRVERYEVDFLWRDARLIVEVDGYRYHRSPSAFEDDRERDVVLALAGWQVLRFTWAQISRRRSWVANAVLRRLAP